MDSNLVASAFFALSQELNQALTFWNATFSMNSKWSIPILKVVAGIEF